MLQKATQGSVTHHLSVDQVVAIEPVGSVHTLTMQTDSLSAA